MNVIDCVIQQLACQSIKARASSPAGIEDLREKREEVQKQIRDEENEKAKLQQDLQMLTKRLAHINDGLARKVQANVLSLPQRRRTNCAHTVGAHGVIKQLRVYIYESCLQLVMTLWGARLQEAAHGSSLYLLVADYVFG